MSTLLDATHDPALQSWVASANAPDTDFPLQNLPYGRFRRNGTDEPLRIGVAIGDQVLDLQLALSHGRWPSEIAALLQPLADGDLLAVMQRGVAARRQLRAALSGALRQGSDQAQALGPCLAPLADIELALPCRIGEYSDFYAGIHHATAVGRLFRPDNPLLPNYKWVPIGYHGRVSSIGVSGQPVHRPRGQLMLPDAKAPVYEPCRRLDYELELGVLVGRGNPDGVPLTMAQAEDGWFGLVLLNDWSARDIQSWEYQPLGPFLSKSFGTTLSPWVVTAEALAPFRQPFVRPAGDPQPLPHLDSEANRAHGSVDIELEVWLHTRAMREQGQPPHRLSQSNFRESYWSIAQLLAHHSSNGCNVGPGDLLGSGTQSGPSAEQGGSLLELSAGGKQPIALPNGETRTFLADGDRITLRAHCAKPGARRIGFGECAGTILPAR